MDRHFSLHHVHGPDVVWWSILSFPPLEKKLPGSREGRSVLRSKLRPKHDDVHAMALAQQTLYVPVNDKPQLVEVHLDALPDDVDVVLQLLQGEIAPPALWIDVAVSGKRTQRDEPLP